MRLVSEHLDQIRIGLPDNDRTMFSDNASLFPRNIDERWTCKFSVIKPNVRDNRHRCIDHIRRVPSSKQPDLNDHDVNGYICKPAKGGRSNRLEETWPHSSDHL